MPPPPPLPPGARLKKPYSVLLGLSNVQKNNNKFYRLQIWKAKAKAKANPYHYYLVATWGRIGATESRKAKRFATPEAAVKAFCQKYRQKTGHPWSDDPFGPAPRPGKYLPIQTSSTAKAITSKKKKKKKPLAAELDPEVRDLVRRIFRECKGWIKKRLDVSYREAEIHTPLGPLDAQQVRRGKDVLDRLDYLVKSEYIHEVGVDDSGREVDHYRKAPPPEGEALHQIAELSSLYYSLVPHKFSSAKAAPPLLSSTEAVWREVRTLRLLEDLNRILLRDRQVLRTQDPRRQYASLGCDVEAVPAGSAEFRKMQRQVKPLTLKRLFRVRRQEEDEAFVQDDNTRQLFHGSRMHNWLGILSKGMLLPTEVEATGVVLTDWGWLGRGLYFGDHETAALYASSGGGGTAYILASQVALGKAYQTLELDQKLTAPPPGYDSCHGVKTTLEQHSAFQEDEYVVYENNRKRMTHLLEIEGQTGAYAANV